MQYGDVHQAVLCLDTAERNLLFGKFTENFINVMIDFAQQGINYKVSYFAVLNAKILKDHTLS